MITKNVEAGCDWMTGTAATGDVESNLMWSWELLKSEEQYPRSFIKKATFEGYGGERIEHGFFGRRPDGCCVVLSGPLAAKWAHQFIETGARPSRLDFQVTARTSARPGVEIERMFESARSFHPTSQRPPQLKMWVGRKGVEGLYVGARSSEVMLRIYDKGVESRQKHYDGHLRVEVELKRDTARLYAAAWTHSQDDDSFVAGVVKGLCAARGLTIPFDVEGEEVVLHKTSFPTTLESKAAWLKSQVAPTVQSLADEVGWARVASLLMPDTLDKQSGSGTLDIQ